MIVRLLAFPFLIGIIACIYLVYSYGNAYAIYILPQVIVLVVLYILEPEIDWWWSKRNPPKLDLPVKRMLSSKWAFYKGLSITEKAKFEERMALYMVGVAFQPNGITSIPEDVKAVLAASAVTVTYGLENFLLSPFDRVILYGHGFPSPQYPSEIHHCEVYLEDGVLVFTVPVLMAGALQPRSYFPIGIYTYAEAILLINKWEEPIDEMLSWDDIEMISRYTKEHISKTIGLQKISLEACAIVLFLEFPVKLNAHNRVLYTHVANYLNHDPLINLVNS